MQPTAHGDPVLNSTGAPPRAHSSQLEYRATHLVIWYRTSHCIAVYVIHTTNDTRIMETRAKTNISLVIPHYPLSRIQRNMYVRSAVPHVR
jgi:hypothetical protein